MRRSEFDVCCRDLACCWLRGHPAPGFAKPSKAIVAAPRIRFGGFPGSPGPGSGKPSNTTLGASRIRFGRFSGPPARAPENLPKRFGMRTRLESFPGPPARGPGKTIQNKIGGASTSFWRVGTLETLQNDVGGAPNSFWRVSRLRPARDSGNPRKRFWGRSNRFEGLPRSWTGGPGKLPKTIAGALRHRFGKIPGSPGPTSGKPSKTTSGAARSRFGRVSQVPRPGTRETIQSDFGPELVLKGFRAPQPGARKPSQMIWGVP